MTMTYDDALAERWANWLSQPAGMTDPEAAQAVDDLVREFRNNPTPKGLIKVILGDSFREVSRRVMPGVQAAERYAAELRAQGRLVRVDGNAVAVVPRLPNVFELCEAGRVARGPVAAALETECRNADQRNPQLGSGTVPERLNRWRVLLWCCLMDGRPPPGREFGKFSGAAQLCGKPFAPLFVPLRAMGHLRANAATAGNEL